MLLCLVLSLALGFQYAAVADDVQSEAKTMPFDQCLRLIRQAGTQLGIPPINIVETNDLRVTRFCTIDGSVLVSCSRPDEKLVMTKSPHRSGCD
jgi:hypothetical protein